MINRITDAGAGGTDALGDEDGLPLVFFPVVPDAFFGRAESAVPRTTDDTPSPLVSHDRWSF